MSYAEELKELHAENIQGTHPGTSGTPDHSRFIVAYRLLTSGTELAPSQPQPDVEADSRSTMPSERERQVAHRAVAAAKAHLASVTHNQ